MKYLLFFIRGMPHYVNGAQILTMDDKLHTKKANVTFYRKYYDKSKQIFTKS